MQLRRDFELPEPDREFLNAHGHLTEATTANLWIVEGEHVVTPPLAAGLLGLMTGLGNLYQELGQRGLGRIVRHRG